MTSSSRTFGVTAALAEPVQQFNVQLKNVTADGRYSVVYTSNSFDTTGDAPPGAQPRPSLRLAKGMTIKPEFLQPEPALRHRQVQRLPVPEPAGRDVRTRSGSTPSRRGSRASRSRSTRAPAHASRRAAARSSGAGRRPSTRGRSTRIRFPRASRCSSPSRRRRARSPGSASSRTTTARRRSRSTSRATSGCSRSSR